MLYTRIYLYIFISGDLLPQKLQTVYERFYFFWRHKLISFSSIDDEPFPG